MPAPRATDGAAASVGAVVAALLTACYAPAPLAAQESVWTTATALQETLAYLPASSHDPATLVVALHGFGTDATDMGRMAPAFTSAGLIYAAVQAPYAFDADGRLARDWMLSHRRDPELAERAAAASMDLVDGVVDELSRRYDARQVYLLGFSQGGRMVYRLLADGRGGRFAGVAALGAGFEPESMAPAPRSADGPRVYIGHGTADRVPLAGATAARDFLRQRGYEVTFESFAGGHEVPPEVAQAVVAWILAGRPQ